MATEAEAKIIPIDPAMLAGLESDKAQRDRAAFVVGVSASECEGLTFREWCLVNSYDPLTRQYRRADDVFIVKGVS
ncbi:MAG: hypothetical protein M1522_05310 [Actinobacteria bacterium]|nr:hypothetical protein [Actinomycetota bacterium]